MSEIHAGTIRELFEHDDWACEKLVPMAAGPSDAQLDRSRETGSGSLRRALRRPAE